MSKETQNTELSENKALHIGGVVARSCQHDLKDTGRFDDLYVYLKCTKCGEIIAEDKMDYEDSRYFWTEYDDD